MKSLYFVQNGQSLDIYVDNNLGKVALFGAKDVAETVHLITGVKPEVKSVDKTEKIKSGIRLVRGSGAGDGFAVSRSGSVVIVASATDLGLSYGVHDLLEKNAAVVWARGAKDYATEFIPTNEIVLRKCSYVSVSPFELRCWNTCGVGAEGKDHQDSSTALYYARNKLNAQLDRADPAWLDFGMSGFALRTEGENINYLIDSHPEYFMKNQDGSVRKTNRSQSYINYYNPEVPKVVAKLIADWYDKNGDRGIPQFIMPDDPWFYMEQDGCLLHEQPFTADDGTVVTPDKNNYKSTVFFNFMNRVANELKILRPQAKLATFAYMYSEIAPEIEIAENLYVMLAVIRSNEKHSYIDGRFTDNLIDKQNVERWARKCKNLCMYNYWNAFAGTIYSRPILRVVKQNLLWYRSLGITCLTPEGKLDGSKAENMSESQKYVRKFFDMNEAYTYVINKLMWDPEIDVDKTFERFCEIVYKESAKDMLEYFKLIEKGWNAQDALVWWTTGGDVYILNFIIRAGIKEKVLSALERAKEKAKTPSVVERVESIYETVKKQIGIYENFVDEDAFVLEIQPQDLFSEKVMDYRNNPNSIWNKAIPLKVLRNYKTFEFYPKEAEFDCRMLYDKTNLYLGFTIKDDMIDKQVGNELFRSDGTKVVSYAETYIGGNDLNKSEYYGYISGVWERAPQFYLNAGAPEGKPIPQGFIDKKFIKWSDKPDQRYLFHVQVVPISSLNVLAEDFHPYGSFVYYSNRFGRAGWKGNGLWSKQNFSGFTIIKEGKNGKD